MLDGCWICAGGMKGGGEKLFWGGRVMRYRFVADVGERVGGKGEVRSLSVSWRMCGLLVTDRAGLY